MLKICSYEGCLNRSIKNYCKREHDHLNEKKEKLKKPRTPVKKVSDKERVRQQAYRKQRIEFLKSRQNCEVCGTCGDLSVHHKAGRIGDNLTDQSTFLAVCIPCHEKIETHPDWAKANGYSTSRLNKAS